MSDILIVSTDPAVSGKVVESVSREDRKLIRVDSAAEGIEVVAGRTVDLVILDRGAESGEGLQLLAECDSAAIPLLLLGSPIDLAGGEGYPWEDGVFDCLPLPVEASLISARVEIFERVKRRLDRLRAQAVIDELTHSYNRRYLDEQMAIRLGEAKRYGLPFSFILFDLDHFKSVNDTNGHQFGDLVLREAAQLVRGQIRKEDVLTRYGGEEFGIISPHTDKIGATILAERVRKAMAANVFETDERRVQVTISLGVATYPLDEVETVEALIGCADKRLYAAKAAGRNRTESG
jgi:diguanylate cyclase (GGDEF)-like protein